MYFLEKHRLRFFWIGKVKFLNFSPKTLILTANIVDPFKINDAQKLTFAIMIDNSETSLAISFTPIRFALL